MSEHDDTPAPRPILASCLIDLPGIAHGFFTREGGVSEGLYATLNCGLGSADDAARVAENRGRVARSLAGPDAQVVTLHQVHSATAVVVDAPIPRQRLPRADALVTRTRRLVLGVLAADCAPVLIADRQAKVVAAAHAGWRGALAGVVEAAVEAMEGLGGVRARMRAAVGPCINQPAYEVGPEFEAEFLRADAANFRFFVRASEAQRPCFDLPAYVEHRLGRLGLAAVERRTPCTYENESIFFSYRRSIHQNEPDYGRHISAIVVT
jgi:YfiH family protein